VIAANRLLLPVALTVCAAPAAAQRIAFDIPAGPLGRSAIELARTARASIGLTDLSLANRPARRVRGTMTLDRAVAELLRGTGARAVRIDARTYRIVRDEIRRVTPRPVVRPAVVAPPPRPIETAALETDIVVTALKRPVFLSDVPGSITVVSGGDPAFDLASRGTDALTGRLHSITSTHFGSGRNKLFIRGIADSSFNGPTQATVGQYLGETRINYNAPDPDLRLYDIERVEVLAGPQGTLYGAGSLGGIIRVVPNRPRLDAAEGVVSLGAALTAHGEAGYDSAAMLNLPIVFDAVGLRVVGYGIRQGGYIDDRQRGLNNINSTEIWGGRAALAGEFGGGWRLQLSGTTQRARSDDAQFADRDAPPLIRSSPVAQPFRNSYDLADLTLTREWDGYRLVASAGLVSQSLRERYDSTRRGGPPTVFDQLTTVDMLSSELRLSRTGSDGVNWLLGSSLVKNRATQRRALGAPEAPTPIPGTRNEVVEATLFGEASVRPLAWLSLGAGARLAYTHLSDEALDAEPFLAPALRTFAQRDQFALLPSASVTIQPEGPLFGYLRYQEGFRPGGLAASNISVQRFRSDRVKTLEAGLRYGLPGEGSFDASVALAHTRWKNIQADVVDFGGFPTTSNIGDGRIYSVDARIGWRPLPGLSFEAAGLFNDSQVINPALTIIITPRSELPNVARWNGRLWAEYRFDLDDAQVRVGAAGRYVGRSRLGIGPVLGEKQGDWLDVSLNARVEFERHAVSLIVTNLLDQAGNRFALGSPFTLVEQPQLTPLVPRTVRLGWELRF
jgi:outer membrane receptor protein involved in Fe transport